MQHKSASDLDLQVSDPGDESEKDLDANHQSAHDSALQMGIQLGMSNASDEGSTRVKRRGY